MKKWIGVIFFAILLALPASIFAQMVQLETISVVLDPVDQVIIVNGNINIGGDRTIFATMYNEQETLVSAVTTMSNESGDFSFSIGVDGIPAGTYKIFAQYRDYPRQQIYTYTGIDGIEAEPIAAMVEEGYLFMDNDTQIDEAFCTAKLTLENARTIVGDVAPEQYVLQGLPAGLSADLRAVSANQLLLAVTGSARQAVTEACDLQIKLKSGIILSGVANTASEYIQGVTLYPAGYGKQVHLDKTRVEFSMQSYKTPAAGSQILTLRYRTAAAAGKLQKGVDYDYTAPAAMAGMTLEAVMGKESGTIQLTLAGAADSNVTSDIVIRDLVFREHLAQGAGIPSAPIQVTIHANHSGGSGSGGSGGGGTGGTGNGAPSLVIPPATETVPPIIPVEVSVLTDIEHHWAKVYIEKLNDLGYVSGYTDQTFRPENLITRAEFVTFIVRILDLETKQYTGPYADVSAGDWYSAAIQAALDAGLIAEDHNFRPNDNITRAEITKIAVDAYLTKNTLPQLTVSLSSVTDSGTFPDWARDSIQNGLSIGIISGYDTGEFLPQNHATRAEAAAILARLVDCIDL